MKKMNNKGFSLIELIIVIAIMAVLVAIIAPNLTKYLGKSKKETDNTNKNEVIKQVKNCISEAATDGTMVVSGGSGTAVYQVKGGSVHWDTSSGCTQDFAKLLASVFDSDTQTKSKVNSANDAIEVKISGSESEGFSVEAKFVNQVASSSES